MKFDNESFKKDWEKIDSLINQGLPKSALDEIEIIFNKARRGNNPGQIIKCVIHQIKFISSIEEDALPKILKNLNGQLANFKFPEKQILSSLVAEMYWNYYTNNRHYFLQRSTTLEFDSNDIQTWDLKRIVETCVSYYKTSLTEPANLQRTNLNDFCAILN